MAFQLSIHLLHFKKIKFSIRSIKCNKNKIHERNPKHSPPVNIPLWFYMYLIPISYMTRDQDSENIIQTQNDELGKMFVLFAKSKYVKQAL